MYYTGEISNQAVLNSKYNAVQTQSQLGPMNSQNNQSSRLDNQDVRAKNESSRPEQSQNLDLEPEFVMHKVDFSDTLEGLSLQYGVSATAIKKFNDLDGDFFYYLKEVKIPNPSILPLR